MATTAGIEPAFIGIDACYTAHQPLLHRTVSAAVWSPQWQTYGPDDGPC
jgi:hypothetical protein